jgi:hypothetical protein
MSLAVAGLTGSARPASAAVVVPPGAAGHTCSQYHYVDQWHYWQTCAWADYRYVWFTIHFGNPLSEPWYPSYVELDYIKSGVDKVCPTARWWVGDIIVPRWSVLGTERRYCVITRVPGAYASNAYVQQDPLVDAYRMHSPTLQVQ